MLEGMAEVGLAVGALSAMVGTATLFIGIAAKVVLALASAAVLSAAAWTAAAALASVAALASATALASAAALKFESS